MQIVLLQCLRDPLYSFHAAIPRPLPECFTVLCLHVYIMAHVAESDRISKQIGVLYM